MYIHIYRSVSKVDAPGDESGEVIPINARASKTREINFAH